MIAKIIKPKCLLLDANIVIKAYELEVWLLLIERVEVIIPSIVINDEARFYKRRIGGIPEEVNLRALAEEGRISELVLDGTL